jgi:hypothetical protein
VSIYPVITTSVPSIKLKQIARAHRYGLPSNALSYADAAVGQHLSIERETRTLCQPLSAVPLPNISTA